MPALNITGVDTATDQLTIVGHGLNTGDGFNAIYSPDGGAIPTGLAPVTDYWAIRVDADHVKLADSSANALAGTAIDITSAGSGTLQLLRGLPYRVPSLVGPGSQVKSADLNATWLALVALWNFLTGQAQAVFTAITLAANQHITVSGTGKYKRPSRVRKVAIPGSLAAGGTIGTLGQWTATAAGQQLLIPLVVNEGERIQSVALRYSCGATDAFQVQVMRGDPVGQTATQLGVTFTTDHTGTTQAATVAGLTEAVSSADAFNYFVIVTVNALAGAPKIWGGLLTTDVP
jgi:hypothetical protein